MKKIIFNNKILLIVLLAVTLFGVFVLTGSSIKGDIVVRQNGKGTAIISIKSTAEENVFSQKMKGLIDGNNLISGYDDMLEVKSITKNAQNYDVKISFRRIDKLKLNGKFGYNDLIDYVSDGSESMALLEKFNNGNISCTFPIHYDGFIGQISVSRDEQHQIMPYKASGERIDLEDLVKASKLDNNSKLLMFQVLDVGDVDSVKIRLPGKMRFFGGDSITVVGQDEVEIKPINIKATLLINRITQENGVEKIETTTEIRDIKAFVGYVVYDNGVNLAVVVMTVAVVGLVVASVILIFVRCVKKGKDILNKRII